MRSRDSVNDAQSISSRKSDVSVTAIDPDSARTTPLTPSFPTSSGSCFPVSFIPTDGYAEDDLDNPVHGWPQVAVLMAKTPDFASFSRFRDLNIKSLLYYQAELSRLRKKLHEAELEDARRGDTEASKYALRADKLMRSEAPNNEQWEIVKKIRIALKEYSESNLNTTLQGFTDKVALDDALLQYSQICALPEPEPHNMKSLRKWLRDKDAGGFCIGGNGEENTWGYLYETEEETGSLKWQFVKMIWALIWSQPTPSDDLDLVSTLPPRKIDGFSRWVASRFIPFWANYKKHKQNKRDNNSNANDEAKTQYDAHIVAPPQRSKPSKEFSEETLAKYSEKGILRFTSAVSTIVACLLPTIAITVLSQLHRTRDLLLTIAGFAIVFAVGLIFLTNGTASRIDIFTATAAYVVLHPAWKID